MDDKTEAVSESGSENSTADDGETESPREVTWTLWWRFRISIPTENPRLLNGLC